MEEGIRIAVCGANQAGRIKPIPEVAYLRSTASIAFVSAGNSHLHHHGKTPDLYDCSMVAAELPSMATAALLAVPPVLFRLSHLIPLKRAAFRPTFGKAYSVLLVD